MNIIALRIVASLGLLLAIYAVYVETRIKKDYAYEPVCELGNNASCKNAFNSDYGKILGVSNASLGILFYITFIAITFTQYTNLLFILSTISALGSLYLAYALYFKLRNVCVVCTMTYIVNALLLIFVLI